MGGIMYQIQQSLNLGQFTSALQTGGLKTVMVDVAANRFLIRAYTRHNNCLVTLVTTRSKTKWRMFNNPLEPLQMLRSMGATKVEMQLSDWTPEKPRPYLRRADASKRLQEAHQAAKVQAKLNRERAEAEAKAKAQAPGLMVLDLLRRGIAADAFTDGSKINV